MSDPPAPAGAPGIAVVIGASGGIGGALVERLLAGGRHRVVLALSRAGTAPEAGPHATPAPDGVMLERGRIDLLDEASIAAAFETAASLATRHDAPVRLVLVATGALQGEGIAAPERTIRRLDAESMLAAYRLNAVGPALVARHALELLPRQGRSVFAALSARVGSIGDNRAGGWHAYRASKAALNMILRNLAIELARTHPEAICLGLHPGTVATALSRPFRSGAAASALFTPAHAAACLVEVMQTATTAQSGQVLAYDRSMVPP